MKIGVLSDTHISSMAQAQALAQQLLSGCFADVDVVLHAGDQVCGDLEQCFYPLPWYSVRGNMDQHLIGIPVKRTLSLTGKSIGMMHGWGNGCAEVRRNVLDSFAAHPPDVLVFGHTHYPMCRHSGTTLLFNPGSPTQKRSAPFTSVGLLYLGERVRGEIIPFVAQ